MKEPGGGDDAPARLVCVDVPAVTGRPLLVDLFCGAGLAADGYHAAGFDIVGVDIRPQPNYPFEFVQDDALAFLSDLRVRNPPPNTGFHASPPCQLFTRYGNAVKDLAERYEDLIEPTRRLLEQTGLPYVIENVEGAPLHDPVVLCGSMFDLDVRRHRLFETNWPLEPHPWPCRHGIWSRRFKAATGRKPNSRFTIEVGSWDEPLERQKAAMGIPQDRPVTTRELSEGIPPAYTEHVGAQLLAHIQSGVAAA